MSNSQSSGKSLVKPTSLQKIPLQCEQQQSRKSQENNLPKPQQSNTNNNAKTASKSGEEPLLPSAVSKENQGEQIRNKIWEFT